MPAPPSSKPHFQPKPLLDVDPAQPFLWPHEGRWRVFCVGRRYADGCVARCLHPQHPDEHFLPLDQWVAALTSEAWAEALAPVWDAPHLALQIQGASMAPCVPLGAWVEVEPLSLSALEVGQVVVWSQSPRWNTHRIRAVRWQPRGPQVSTRGDALAHDDPPLGLRQILGQVQRVSWEGRSWSPSTCRAQLRPRARWLWSAGRAALKPLLRY